MSIFNRLVNLCWFWFRWAATIVLAGAVLGAAYVYVRLDEEITRHARGLLQSHYSQLEVEVGAARYHSGSGIVVTDLSIADPASAQPRPLLHIEELRLIGEIDAQAMLEREPRVERIEVRRPTLAAQRSVDGRWSVQPLLPPPPMGDRAPPIEIVDATLVVSDEAKPNAPPLVVRNVNLTVTRTPLPPAGGPSDAGRAPARQRIEVEGTAEESLARSLQFKGGVDSDGGRLELTYGVNQLGVTSERIAALPGLSTSLLVGLAVDANVDAEGAVRRAAAEAPLEWECDFQLSRGTINHPLFPKQLTDVEVVGQCDQDGVRVQRADAKGGAAELTGALNMMGWGPSARAAMRLDATGVALGKDVYEALPDSLQRAWDRFRPEGEVDAHAEVQMGGGRVYSNVELKGRELSFEDRRKFPYRLTGGTGTLRYADQPAPSDDRQHPARDQTRLTVDISAHADDGSLVHIQGDLRDIPSPETDQGECPLGWLRISTPSIRLTDRLLSALPPDSQNAIRLLAPEGRIDVTWQLQRDSYATAPSTNMDLVVLEGAVKFKHLPYRLRKITGVVQQRGEHWEFRDFVSRDGGGGPTVRLHGELEESGGRPRLNVHLSGVGVPLNEELRTALSPEQQEAWAALRPSGEVDFEADVAYTAGERSASVKLQATPSGQTVSLFPTFFPYRLENVTGNFEFNDGVVTFTGARAAHNETRFTADGEFTPRADGGWRFHLAGLNIDQLNASQDFRAAAPAALRKVIDQLQPTGGVGVHHGRLTFVQPGDVSKPVEAEWDVQIECHQVALDCGVSVKNVFGAVGVRGQSAGGRCRSSGTLRIDSLTCNGVQLTSLGGPFWCDENMCVVGRGVAQQQGGEPRSLVADAYGGVVGIDAMVNYQSLPRYGAAVTLDAVDLTRLSDDYLHNGASLSGKMDGKINLSGMGESLFSLEGNGRLVVRDADLYELPVVVSMLKVLRNRVPNTTAFNRCEAEFTLHGQHLTFSQLDLLGDAISLYGRGEAGLDRRVDLVFHSFIGRNDIVAPMLRKLVGQASEQMFQLKVTGPLNNAKVTPETLPIFNNVWQQIRQETHPSAARSVPTPDAAWRR